MNKQSIKNININNKSKKFNRTRKRQSQNTNVMELFIGTKNLPVTNIIKYVKDNYPNYAALKAQADQEGKNVLYLDGCFVFQKEFPMGNRQLDSINTTATQNSRMPLDKLIAYSFYMMTNYMFVDTNTNKSTSLKKTVDLIKFQIGKDVKRSNILLNGAEYSNEYFSKYEDYYQTTDQYCELLINTFKNFSKSIDYDIINKILLLTCQNIFNLITDLIVIKVNDVVSPETCSVFRPSKSITIILTEKKQTMEFNFTTSLIISRNGEPMDPEYPCGSLSFVFYVDLLKNTYGFSTFQLSYDINKCGPELESNSNANNNSTEKSKFKWAYAIPAAIGTAGVIATPFIMAALGGKRKRKGKKNKTVKKNKY